ncbi:MAG: peptidoglycan DD-metalloendopeptidase family protein [Thermoleophilaceae bacterium]
MFRRSVVSVPVLLALLAFPPLAQGEGGWRWPVHGRVITHYRNGSDPYAAGQHRGIDIAAPKGTAVVAATAGTVRFAGRAGSSGLVVAVRTADGRYDTSYLHLSVIAVARGQRVDPGRRLGAVGTSGRRSASEPHLHFGVRDAGSRHAYHDPLRFLPPPGGPVRPEPRGAPAPVPVPVRESPAPVRVAPHEAPLPAPAGAPIPEPAPEPVPHGSPFLRPRPLPGTAAAPVRAAPRSHAPGLAPAPWRAPAGVPRPAPAHPVAEGGRGGGLDPGWVLACLGLLLAAGLMGGGAEGRRAAAGGRARLRAALHPLLGLRG